MTSISIIGAGKMAMAITDVFARAGASIQIIRRRSGAGVSPDRTDVDYGTIGDPLTGELVVLAVPFEAIGDLLAQYRDQLDGKVVIDISNPIDFTTYDELLVPADSSAAGEIAKDLPGAAVVKAFNVNFGDTLSTGTNGTTRTTVLLAGDDAEAKMAVVALIEAAGLRAVDAGPLSRARELEALGFLQIVLAAIAKTQYETGFTLLP
jgi:predicted dinucleotide-binding enzyme